jgi:hypothetical protein
LDQQGGKRLKAFGDLLQMISESSLNMSESYLKSVQLTIQNQHDALEAESSLISRSLAPHFKNYKSCYQWYLMNLPKLNRWWYPKLSNNGMDF